MSQDLASPAPGHGPDELPACSLCHLAVRSSWPLCPEDRYCGLCGERILHLRVAQPTPGVRHLWEPPGEEVWLYWRTDSELTVMLTWSRHVQNRHSNQFYRPVLDVEHSGAKFQTRDGGGLDFAFAPVPANGDANGIICQLVPRQRIDAAALRGACAGRLRLAFANDLVVRPARLIPVPAEMVRLQCEDPSVQGTAGRFQVYQRLKDLVVPMTLHTQVPLWVLKSSANLAKQPSEDVTLHGFEQPVLVQPGRPCAFELRVSSSRWEPGVPHAFRFVLVALSLKLPLVEGQIALVEGSKLAFRSLNPVHYVVCLGETQRRGCELELQAGQGGTPEPIRLLHAEVHADHPQAEWFQLLEPLPVAGQAVEITSDSRVSLQFWIDTRRLERSKFDGKTLSARIELVDELHRNWTYQVYVQLRRWPPLEAFVAIDWGTTNSCAAYRTGGDRDGLHPLPLSEQQASAPEIFPSDIYFEDLTDVSRPIFHVGYEALARMQEHPECALHSIKRRFPHDEHVFVMPEKGPPRELALLEVVKLLLRRLISQAEALEHKEVRRLGLTFPTKWPPSVRRRLEQVAAALRAELRADLGGDAVVVVDPPEIDEANAVALNLLFGGIERALPDQFCLIAYDFGGGTVDTSVLEVKTAGGRLVTRYIGIGGREDFGGDDVTFAVMVLLRDRLLLAFEAQAEPARGATRPEELPLVRDGTQLDPTRPDPPKFNRLGRRNWDTLWRIAEQVKMDLCSERPEPDGVSQRLRIYSHEIWFTMSSSASSSPGAEAAEYLTLEELLNRFHDGGTALLHSSHLTFSLAEACADPLADVAYTNGGQRQSVQQRLEDTIAELQWQCREARVEPDFIVLAGGGCRLPLVAQAMRDAFRLPDADRLIFDPHFSKRRVAHGLAGFLYLTHQVNLGFELARSVDVVHNPIGLLCPELRGGQFAVAFRTIVPVGASIHSEDSWHTFTFQCGQIGPHPEATRAGVARAAAAESHFLVLTVRRWHQRRAEERQLGCFDLRKPGARGAAQSPADVLPVTEATYRGELRLLGASAIELRVHCNGRQYGPYPMETLEVDPELLLQA